LAHFKELLTDCPDEEKQQRLKSLTPEQNLQAADCDCILILHRFTVLNRVPIDITSCQKKFDFPPRHCKAYLANHEKVCGKKYQT